MSRIENIVLQLFNQDSYVQLGKLLNFSNLNYAVIKGEVLSKQIYNKTGQRNTSDIDILIPRAKICELEKVLSEGGFCSSAKERRDEITLLSNSHQVAPWIKETPPWGLMVVDINFDVMWGEYEGKRIDIEEFLSDTIEMEIYGIQVKTLPPIKAMIQLILHHYKDMNSIFLLATRKSIKYDMFKDIYYLLMNNLDTITLENLYAMSAEYEIIPYVFYILYYTGRVFEDETLKRYIKAFTTPEGEALLNCYGLCAKERKQWKCDFKARLETDSLYELIRDDLTAKDKEKISINKCIFMGESE